MVTNANRTIDNVCSLQRIPQGMILHRFKKRRKEHHNDDDKDTIGID